MAGRETKHREDAHVMCIHEEIISFSYGAPVCIYKKRNTLYARVSVCMYVHIKTKVHTHTQKYIHTHAHTHTQILERVSDGFTAKYVNE